MAADLKTRVRRHAEAHPERTDVTDRLLSSIAHIERDFEGAERERLLRLAERTFERHVLLVEAALDSRDALARIDSSRRRLLELLDFLAAEPQVRLLH